MFSIGEESGSVLAFDLEGRIIFATLGKYTIRRSLMNRYVKITLKGGERRVESLGDKDIEEALSEIRGTLESFIVSANDDGLRKELENFGKKLDAEWLTQDGENLKRIYHGGVPIVPPDQYFSLYIRYTNGCSWNRCSFCRLYPGMEYGVMSLDNVERQIDQLHEALGRGFESRRTVFLGDANAISTRTEMLIDVLNLIKRRINLPVYAFSDAFTTPRNKSCDDFVILRQHGLSRIYVGIESGDGDVLKILNKPMDLNVAREEISQIKAAGISVGAIVMSGAGGRKYSSQHVSRTVDFIASLPLGRGDIVYISPIVTYPDSEYGRIAKDRNLGIMDEDENIRQALLIRNSLKDKWKTLYGRNPDFPIAPYLLAESIY